MNWKILFASFGLVFLAELGDKTQLTALAFSAKSGSPWAVFLGTSLALICASGLAVGCGELLSRVVPERILHLASGVMFVLVGLILLVNMARKAPDEAAEPGDGAVQEEGAALKAGPLSSFILQQAIPFERDLVALIREQAAMTEDKVVKEALLRLATEHRGHESHLSGIGADLPAGGKDGGELTMATTLPAVRQNVSGGAAIAEVVAHQEACAQFYIALAQRTPFHAARDGLRSLAMEEIRLAQELCTLVNHEDDASDATV